MVTRKQFQIASAKFFGQYRSQSSGFFVHVGAPRRHHLTHTVNEKNHRCDECRPIVRQKLRGTRIDSVGPVKNEGRKVWEKKREIQKVKKRVESAVELYRFYYKFH